MEPKIVDDLGSLVKGIQELYAQFEVTAPEILADVEVMSGLREQHLELEKTVGPMIGKLYTTDNLELTSPMVTLLHALVQFREVLDEHIAALKTRNNLDTTFSDPPPRNIQTHEIKVRDKCRGVQRAITPLKAILIDKFD